MHCHQSISKNGDNLFYDGDDPNHLSTIAYGYMAGQLARKSLICGCRAKRKLVQAAGSGLRSAGLHWLGAS